MKHVRALAAAQTVPVRGDVDANIAQHIRLIEAAGEERPEVIVFPELSLTGYELDLAEALAFTETDSRLRPLVDLAAQRQVTLVVGAPVIEKSVLYLGALIIARDGTIDLYTKHYLGAFAASDNPNGAVPPAEATVFHPGTRNPLVPFGDYTAAVAVCADVGRPAHARAAADRGVNAYLASMFVIPSDLEKDTSRLESYAREHAMAVVFANYGGPSGGLPSGGRSAIWSEKGERLVQLDAAGSGLAIAIERDAGWQAKAITL